MADWFVGTEERTLARWTRHGVLLADGEAWARYTNIASGAVEYLQDDESWDTALFEFPLAFVPGVGFERFFLIPASARRKTVREQVRHSIYGLTAVAEHFVRSFPDDLDQDHKIDAAGVLTVFDAINHATVLARWQLYDRNDVPAVYGRGAVRRVRL